MNDLMCFRHCSVDKSIFYLATRPISSSSVCPLCKRALRESHFIVPPFRIASPLTKNAVGIPHSLTIKPSSKSFVDYCHGDDLHVGVSDSRGRIHHYDEFGLHCDSNPETTFWTDCLLIQNKISQLTNIEECIQSDEWTQARYEPDTLNCYDFVVSVVNESEKSRVWTKENFCREILLPHTSRVGKFLLIFRRALNDILAVV
ncbi:MKRN2 opposite strand protein-like [Oscarella lobularis]|uniref:MKRN2 opposite strand protein-like n=1 Tax=Oscarella lobularis TaxID=121494 RepID=UPI003313D12B